MAIAIKPTISRGRDKKTFDIYDANKSFQLAWRGLGNIINEFCFAMLRVLGRLLKNVTDYRL